MDITKVYGTFISGSSPDGCTKKLSTFAEFFIVKINAKAFSKLKLKKKHNVV